MGGVRSEKVSTEGESQRGGESSPGEERECECFGVKRAGESSEEL